jgi:hypothetical protein
VTELEAEVSSAQARTRRGTDGAGHPKKSHCVFCEGDSCPVRTDDDAAPPVSTGPAVSVLEVSRSGYHAWRTGRPSTRAQENARLEVAVQAAHVRTRQTYGPERLQAELRDDGFPVGVGRIKRLRKKRGLRCKLIQRFTTTTESQHTLPVAENVLAQTFVATRPPSTFHSTPLVWTGKQLSSEPAIL